MSYLIFNQEINNQKPNTIRNKSLSCPFCNEEQLSNVVETFKTQKLVENKYPTIKDADMFVLIETNTCEKNLFNYTREEYTNILSFNVQKWLEYKRNNKYQDAILFKNYGPLSGGSIKHEHMQIIAFKNNQVDENVRLENLLGVEVLREKGLCITISDQPINNYLEYNLEFTLDNVDVLAKYLMLAIKYLKSKYKLIDFSYNLFFYQIDERLFVKVISRYATSPLYIGFKLQQCYSKEQLSGFKHNLLNYIEENNGN